MESFSKLKRRGTDLLQNAQQNLPSMPQMPQMQMPQMPARNKQSQQPGMKATWERLDIPSLPRSSHSLNIVSGSAYIFGGEINPREPVDDHVHVITLPFSGAGSDYYKIKAAAAPPEETPRKGPGGPEQVLGSGREDGSLTPAYDKIAEGKGKERATDEAPASPQVPGPRVGHATATIGSRIFLFGGRGGPDMTPLEEAGRVWVFNTRSHTWSHLDPAPAVIGGAIVPHPSPRSYHCATATDKPQDFARPPPSKPQNWRQWALGDISKTGIPQDPVVGNVAENAVDQEAEGYGTFFIHGGCMANGDRTSDLWAFDVRTSTWTPLPAAPGPSRGGSAICISKNRLFRYGGFDGEKEVGGELNYLDLEVEMFDDKVTKGEISIHARGSWQSIYQGNTDASSTEIPIQPFQEWPAARSVASLQALTIGGGREYLVLAMGEGDPSSQGHAGAGKFFDDVWTFQVPPMGMSAASLKDAVLQAAGRKTSEGKWTRLVTAPYDDDNDDEEPRPRGWLASAVMTDLEESAIVMWGGLGEDNKRIGDGWILRIGSN